MAACLTRLRRGRRGSIDELELSDRRSLAFGLLLAKRLVVEPEVVRRRAQANLDRLRRVHSDGSADRYLDRWEKLLSGPVEAVLGVLTSLDEDSIDLRHTAPFAGMLTEAERQSVIRTTRRTAA